MWVVLLPNDVLTVTILPESLYEALVILPPYPDGFLTENQATNMSALGQKQTFREVRVMSALPPKADI
jgi:hypothetical protein